MERLSVGSQDDDEGDALVHHFNYKNLRGCISLDGMSIVITVVTSRGDAGLTDCSYQCLMHDMCDCVKFTEMVEQKY